ncbi:ParM/StbA family protein [Rhodovastum atsumiense]|uniref:ParM/StbA family protein n=1 Tax=Rhodovastum atsumiense TaxID=504468 RepID=A0A5M6ILH1_9PROT|nr:ParM/StbA family protein [Rhodovastum atsumiense]KAA5609116.1 ParM/StbA family protein [Rhodovastum atsumiense]CAH2603793.1 ParM/StbA family protein [Rhodovastum atsumiense]
MARKTVVQPRIAPRVRATARAEPAPADAEPAPVYVGLDIGYSNLKLIAGPADGDPTATVLPAGAGPRTAMPERIGYSAGSSAGEGLVVALDEETWVAGVEPGRLQNWERALHPDYVATSGFRALAHAALLVAGTPRVERLVTGLPVTQWLDSARREALHALLLGHHAVARDQDVEVDTVEVLPQPAGAYIDMLADAEQRAMAAQSRVLVVDAGFFSVDWVLFDEGEIRATNSGTSTAAMSVLLEGAAALIQQERGGRIERELLERALRLGASSVQLFGEPVQLAPYLASAASQTTGVAMMALRQTLRGERREVDVVLLAGGGAETYADAARDAFPRARVVVPPEPVLANVRGFWAHASRHAS